MAAYYAPSLSRISLSGGSRLEHLVLPNGACSYRDLTAGARAPTCGCRRFWLNNTIPANNENERAWCFCGHHACFHEIAGSPSRQTHDEQHAAGSVLRDLTDIHSPQTSPRRRSGMSQALSAAQRGSPSHRSLDANLVLPKVATGLGIQNPIPSQSQSINTRVWRALNNFARDQDHAPNSGTTSKLPSTAVPSIIDEPRASPTRILRERSQHAQYARSMGPPVNIPAHQALAEATEAYSATEVATPSIAGTPDFQAHAVHAVPNSISPGHLAPGIPSSSVIQPQDPPVETTERQRATPAQPVPATANSSAATLSLHDIYNTLQTQSRRIELLESLSFSHVRSEDVQERYDLLDTRVLDLEHWRTDRDKAQADSEEEKDRPSSSKKRRMLPIETSSFTSDLSDTNAAAQTEAVVLATLAANAETHPRIDALESRILDLENAALPSFARPWHVQVVLLPFGHQLPGIWFSSRESTWQSLQSTQLSEEWPGAHTAPQLSFRSTTSAAWTTESIQAWANETQEEWLSPKACGPSGTVFQRLASRGFVQDIELTAPDASHINSQISAALGDLLDDQENALSASTEKYHGLRERFIPLRKVRKSSRLRFLSPAEMVTSSTWTSEFLDSSVFMKMHDGHRRLYLTTSQGYTQPLWAGWSWSSLRDLPVYDSQGQTEEDQVDKDLMEACWTPNERLDRRTSLQPSLASNELWSVRDGSSVRDVDAAEDEALATLRVDHPAHMRSVSLPSSASTRGIAIEALPKRRVASLETSTSTSDPQILETFSKRRRISSSPEIERRGVMFTPRWSGEPPSPYTHEEAAYSRSQMASNGKRGITPLAYATPHSNLDSRGGDGDTEIDMDASMMQSEHGDELEEWEGVQDGTGTELLHGDADKGNRSSAEDEDDDFEDEDLDD